MPSVPVLPPVPTRVSFPVAASPPQPWIGVHYMPSTPSAVVGEGIQAVLDRWGMRSSG